MQNLPGQSPNLPIDGWLRDNVTTIGAAFLPLLCFLIIIMHKSEILSEQLLTSVFSFSVGMVGLGFLVTELQLLFSVFLSPIWLAAKMV